MPAPPPPRPKPQRKIPAKSVGLTQTPQDLINRLSSINAYKVVLQLFLATPLPNNRENNRVYLALYFGPGAAKISFHLMGLSLKLYSSGPSPPDVEEPQSQALPHPLESRRKTRARKPGLITFAYAHLGSPTLERQRFTHSPHSRKPSSTSAPGAASRNGRS